MSIMTNPEPDERVPALKQAKIASQIRAILLEGGIPLREQASKIGSTLGVAYPTARRMLTGEGLWSDSEISDVLAIVGVEWDGLATRTRTTEDSSETRRSDSGAAYSSSSQLGDFYKTTLNIEGVDCECLVYPKSPRGPPPIASNGLCLSLSEVDGSEGRAHVVAKLVGVSSRDNKADLLAISKIEVNPNYYNTGPLVALLDDDASFVELASLILESNGFLTEKFSTADALLERSQTEPKIDIYLMDWKLQGKATINQHLQQLRNFAPDAAMVIVSGEITNLNDSEFMEAAEKYNLAILTKPAHGVVIVRTLMTQYKSSMGLE